MEETKTVTPQGLFAEMSARLAAISPEQFFKPRQKLREGMRVVGTASDYLKALLTLVHLLDKERGDALSLLMETSDENEAKHLYGVAHRMDVLYQIARQAFWSDARQQHPELATKSMLSISEGWALAYGPDTDTIPGVQVIAIGPEDLKAMFEGLRH